MLGQTQIMLCPEFKLGDDSGPVSVLQLPLQSGDFFLADDTVFVIENDFASLEVPAPFAGRVVRVLAKVGDKATINTPILEIEPILNVFRKDLDSYGRQDDAAPQPSNKTVFLVHGHNDLIREMTARTVEKLGLTAIILNEQVNRSDTIIEKLERHANVNFAVVLMTADDVGGKKSQTPVLQDRARQNVILELGYFMGKVGRKQVCVLYEKGVEVPSDYYGVVYIEIDDRGAWRYALGKELKEAGLQVDLNKL
ncbi:TIR domain-containing protein [Janthinobacterium lividum]|uniref:TIR domain-containing protein n=1 Tax=Janthinobacterium lividum TaxID=29581 RepID=UPI000690EB3D|nr:TIR domain-containing protein [Janthinobacterium lividum]